MFWEVAASVNPDLVNSSLYPHHSLGDAERFANMVTTAGWTVEWSGSTIGIRMCDAFELWGWLWRSLPLRRKDGSFLEGERRNEWEERIRLPFFEEAKQWICRDSESAGSVGQGLMANNQYTDEKSSDVRYRIPSTTHTIRATKNINGNWSREC